MPMTPIVTFSKPGDLALAIVGGRGGSKARGRGDDARGAGVDGAAPAMMATSAAAAEAHGERMPSMVSESLVQGGPVVDCAKLYLKLAIAKSPWGNPAEVPALEEQVAYSTCDPLWAEALTTFEWFLLSGKTQPYVRYPRSATSCSIR